MIVVAGLWSCGGFDKYEPGDGSSDAGTDETVDTGVDTPWDVPGDTPWDPDVDSPPPDVPADPISDDVADMPSDSCDDYPGVPCTTLPHLSNGELMVDITVDAEIADIYILVDTTGSMDSSLTDVANSFTSAIVPAATTAFSDVTFGLGHFNDFPYDTYGQSNDMPYWHMTDMTTIHSSVQSGLDSLPGSTSWGTGLDSPESNVVAAYLTATGDALSAGGASIPARTCSSGGATGYPCFRSNALPVVLMVSDAPWHNGPGGTDTYSFTAPDFDDTVAAFVDESMWFLGVFVDNFGTVGLEDMQLLATGIGSIDDSDQPLVSTGPASSSGSRASNLISTLSGQARFDVTGDAEDVPGDPASGERDATLFVQELIPHSATPPSGHPAPTYDGTTFFDARQSTELVFRVTLRNDDFPSGPAPVAHRAFIVAVGDGRVEVGRQEIVIVVP